MARKTRYVSPNFAHHVVNRGNDRKVIFREHFDHTAFIELLAEGTRRVPVRVFGYCQMPNHFHLLVQPSTETALSAYMQWVTGRYACTLRQQTDTVGHGHVFQRRFWSTPVYDVESFISVLRYIEANPRRCGLIDRAQAWSWSSLADRVEGLHRGVLSALPVDLPADWTHFVNEPQSSAVLERIRTELVPRPGRPKKEMQEAKGGCVPAATV